MKSEPGVRRQPRLTVGLIALILTFRAGNPILGATPAAYGALGELQPVAQSRAQAQKRQVDVGLEAETILERERRLSAYCAAHDLVGFESLLVRDLRFMALPANYKWGHWRSAIQNKSITISWLPNEVQVASSGDLAYTIGTYKVVKAQEAPTILEYVTVWRRLEKEPSWKVVGHGPITGLPVDLPVPEVKFITEGLINIYHEDTLELLFMEPGRLFPSDAGDLGFSIDSFHVVWDGGTKAAEGGGILGVWVGSPAGDWTLVWSSVNRWRGLDEPKPKYESGP